MTRATKTARLDLRLTPEEHELLRAAADLERVPVTTFLVNVATRRAHEVIEENRDTVMAAEAYERFLAELDEPARSVPELIELFSRPPARRIRIS
jgi:uncharacterized protein (DUF1778 family)